MSRPPLEVADLIRSTGATFIERNRQWIRWQHVKVLLAIARCRTAALGGHVDQCTRCGHRATISYNSWFLQRAAYLEPKARSASSCSLRHSCRRVKSRSHALDKITLAIFSLHPSAASRIADGIRKHLSHRHWMALVRCENPPFEAGYGFVSPSSFASWASSILAGRSRGKVQFLKRWGMTA
jgi:Transposase zinc-binding domain